MSNGHCLLSIESFDSNGNRTSDYEKKQQKQPYCFTRLLIAGPVIVELFCVFRVKV